VRFQRDGSPAAEVTIPSVRDISLATEGKQLGRVPMMLGKAAVSVPIPNGQLECAPNAIP